MWLRTEFTWGKYDTTRPKQMKLERAVVNQSWC